VLELINDPLINFDFFFALFEDGHFGADPELKLRKFEIIFF